MHQIKKFGSYGGFYRESSLDDSRDTLLGLKKAKYELPAFLQATLFTQFGIFI